MMSLIIKHGNPCNQFCRSITPSDRGQVKEKVENDNKVCPCINFSIGLVLIVFVMNQ